MRILLDSNIWRYVADTKAHKELRGAVKRSRHSLVIAPAVLFEAAHTKDSQLRSALLSVMVDPMWKRVMPEAFSEAAELKAEIRRLRKEWLRPKPRLHRYRMLLHGWSKASGGVWDRIESDAEFLQDVNREHHERCQDQAYALREDGKKIPPSWRTADMKKTMASLGSPRPGWDGSPIEAWRIDGLNSLIATLSLKDSPTYDWIEGEIDVETMLADDASFTRFWFHDVRAQSMPRCWLRWGFEFLQRLHKTNDGTPVDIQIETYLADVDVMLSADRRFVWIAERCREDAPFKIAKSEVLPANEDAVVALLDRLAESER